MLRKTLAEMAFVMQVTFLVVGVMENGFWIKFLLVRQVLRVQKSQPDPLAACIKSRTLVDKVDIGFVFKDSIWS